MFDWQIPPIAPQKAKPKSPDYGYTTDDIELLKAKVAQVTERLVAQYGEGRWSTKDPLSMLIDIILSHRTKDAQTAQAYTNLKARFATWADMRDAPTSHVQEAIKGVNWPEVKAPRLQTLMRRIEQERGELNLDFLRDLPTDQAARWLDRLEGVGPKTVACVLLFTCQKPILPVDTHVHRVSIRLGLIGSKVTADNAHSLLQNLLPSDPQIIYNYHKGLLRHGQQVCFYNKPACERCVITDLCNYYQTVFAPKKKGNP